MTEEDALIRAALDDPDDLTPRLVLADWLDEHDAPDQAEVIRIRSAIAAAGEAAPPAATLRREGDLCRRHRADWADQCGLPLTWAQAVGQFRRRLSEPAAWYTRGSGTLRTPELDPPYIGWSGRPPGTTSRTCAEQQTIVNRLAGRRARLLADRGMQAGADTDVLSGGRLLAFYPGLTLSDGAAVAVSCGFFDEENIPAWNSWVWLDAASDAPGPVEHRSYLVCWVRRDKVQFVDFAVRINPEQCIRWATDVDTALTRRLRDAGLLA